MNFNEEIEMFREELICSTQDIMRIKSYRMPAEQNRPFGKGIADILEYCLCLASNMGFATKNLDGYCGFAEYGKGDTYIGVLVHLDVVNIGEAWVHPPFGAEIHGGKLFGRGAFDGKGPAMAALYALYAVKASGVNLPRKIRIIFCTDEEHAYEDMDYYLEREKPPILGFTPDGTFPVVYAEKGLAYLNFGKEIPDQGAERIAWIRGGIAINIVPAHCEAKLITERTSEVITALNAYARENKKRFNAEIVSDGVVIEAYGVEVLAADLEFGDNAIMQMLTCLNCINFGGGVLGETIAFLNDKLGIDYYGSRLGVAYEDEFSGKLSINLGKFTLENQHLSIAMDVRTPVTCDLEGAAEQIAVQFEEGGFSLEKQGTWDPVYFPREHFLIDSLLKSYRSITKDMSEAVSSAGATYSKIIPNIAAFGPVFPGAQGLSHECNEFIKVEDLVLIAKIYAKAIYELAVNV